MCWLNDNVKPMALANRVCNNDKGKHNQAPSDNTNNAVKNRLSCCCHRIVERVHYIRLADGYNNSICYEKNKANFKRIVYLNYHWLEEIENNLNQIAEFA